MKLSLKLLKKFIKFKTENITEIERAFTDKVAEIDVTYDQAKWLEKVFIGQIEKITSHPDADRMQVTQTKVWDLSLQIVCWAKNIFEWQKVPVALVWAVLPVWFEIKKADKRWVESCWMICSEAELWLVDSSEWIMEIAEDAQIWENFAKYYWLDDVIFEIENTTITNRPDLFSHNSWAKEAVAIGIAEFIEDCPWLEKNFSFIDKQSLEINVPSSKEWWWELEDFPLNIEFEKWVVSMVQAICMKWVKNWESPDWIKSILKSVDIRPISLLVDATNLAMVITGVPNHVFDLSKIEWKNLKAILSKSWEEVTTLDWKERKLAENVIILKDDKKIFDLCWIMWWENSWVDEDTSDILIHVPVYNPVLIRRASISLNHRSDASAIYEKKVPDSCVWYALECIIKIILDYSKDSYISSKVFEYFPAKDLVNDPINLNKRKIEVTLWDKIQDSRVGQILEDLGFEVDDKGEYFEVSAAKNRYKDINIEEDLIEEISRVYWLQNIKSKAPSVVMKKSELTKWFSLEREFKNILSAQWLYEVLNYAFLWDWLLKKCLFSEDEYVKIENPISEDLTKMRKSLIPYLLDNVSKNSKQSEKFWVFEFANIFNIEDNWVIENKNLAFACFNYSFHEWKAVLEILFEKMWILVSYKRSEVIEKYLHQWQCADIIFQWKKIWIISSIHPLVMDNFDIDKNTVIFEINFEAISNSNIKVRKYKDISRFPGSRRDMNFVLDKKCEVSDFMKKLSLSSKLVVQLDLVDVYSWEQIWNEKKSVSFSIEYWSNEKTLSDKEVWDAHDILLNTAKENWAEFR